MATRPPTTTASSSTSSFTSFLIPLLLLLFLSSAVPPCQGSRFDYRMMDRMLQQLQTCSKMQTVGVAVVGPDTLYERAQETLRFMDEHQQQQEAARVGKDTVFCLGGVTQAFTSVLLSMLLDRHENHTIDTPLRDITKSVYHLPGRFRTRRVNLKDILSMRTGLSNMDIVALAKGMDRYRLMQNLRFAPEVSPFREESVYSEVLFSLAEDAARALGGETWYELMRHYIFEPLGMSGAGFVHTNAESDAKVALPYLLFRDKHHQIPWEAFRGQEVVAAGTSICASVSDMAQWMNFVMTGGKTLDSRELARKDTIHSTFQSVQYRREGDNPRTSGFRPPAVDRFFTRESNALGWIRGAYQGHSYVSQDGSLPGYESQVTILTSGQGAVFTAFTGVGGSKGYAVKNLITMYALDLLLTGKSDLDVCSTMRKMAKATDDADSMSGSHHPRPSYARNEDELIRPAEEYEGTYRNYAFGDVVIRRNDSSGGRLKLDLQYGEFGHYVLHQSSQNDTFIMQAKGPLTYSTDMDDYRLQGPFLAIFGNHHNDPSGRIETVVIPHFAHDTDPEFSKNPTPPREDYGTDGECNAAPTAVAALWTAVVASSVTVVSVFWWFRL